MLQILEKVSARARLEQLLARQEATVRAAFFRFVREAKSDKVIREVTKLIEVQQIEKALGIVDSYIARLGRAIPSIFTASGDAEAEALARQLARMTNIAIRFDPGNPRASAISRNLSLEFVRDFTERQREATRIALSETLGAGQGPRVAASAFRDSIGLTGSQERAVRNYERLLRMGRSEALDRSIRDRRFDSTVRRAVSGEKALSAEQIDRMVERYRARYLVFRSETIARTESVRAVSEARQEAAKQSVEQTGINPEELERVWMATRDSRTRDTHRSMHGQVRGLEQPFRSPSGALLMFPGDSRAPAAETINCRCTVAIRVKS